MAGSQQPSTFMAGSQSVVRGPLGGPTGFQRGPWLVPKVWFGDLSGSLRGFWGLGLGLQSPGTTDQGPPPGTPGDMTVDLGYGFGEPDGPLLRSCPTLGPRPGTAE